MSENLTTFNYLIIDCQDSQNEPTRVKIDLKNSMFNYYGQVRSFKTCEQLLILVDLAKNCEEPQNHRLYLQSLVETIFYYISQEWFDDFMTFEKISYKFINDLFKEL